MQHRFNVRPSQWAVSRWMRSIFSMLSGGTRLSVPEMSTRMLFAANSRYRSKYRFAMEKSASTSSLGRFQFSHEKQ